MPPQQFDHEKFEVYGIVMDFLPLAQDIAMTAKFGDLPDQLRRASLSILTNLGEGAGEFAAAEKVRLYRYAKRSATECAVLIDAARRLNLADEQVVAKARECLLSIVSMLIRLIATTERQKAEGRRQ
jgi:four helix bundle protein